ncbi:hypothetical protein JW796_04295 [Candidatus Dojkabacteria bacterium]|nr:hypothetical protein [Candidatus Dojkabacteria bacterium]
MRNFKLIICFVVFITCLFGTACTSLVRAQENNTLNVYLFYGDGCPHCSKERVFLNTIHEKYPERVSIHEYEVYYNQKDIESFTKAIDHLKIDVAGVPFLVIGEKYYVGYGDDDSTGQEILTEIERCLENGCKDNLSKLLLNSESDQMVEDSTVDGTDGSEYLNVPSDEIEISRGSDVQDTSPIYLNTYVFGNVNLKDISLPIATILIGFVDGFNPCAMWILIFLITMLINMHDKKRLYILGSIFIFTSGLVYFFFLAAWFSFFKFIGYVYWIKLIIGIVAIVSGVIHVKNSLFSKGECHVTDANQRRSIMDKVKTTLSQKSFLLSIIGIVTLAVSVNLVEVVCSAGLPAVYTSLISSIEMTTAEYYLYLLLYVVVFMLDDLFVFFVAMKTFEVTGIAKKYTKWSGLIGGIIIFVIGIILIIKPELLMFG